MQHGRILYFLFIVISLISIGGIHPITVRKEKQLPVKVYVNSNLKTYNKQIVSYLESRLTEKKIRVLSDKELQSLVDADFQAKSKDLFREDNFGNKNGYHVIARGPKYAQVLRVTCEIEKWDSSFSFKKIQYQHYTLPPSQKPDLIEMNLKEHSSMDYKSILDSLIYKVFNDEHDL